MKNILVICGSSRINGETDLITNNYLQGIKPEYNVERFEANMQSFKPCTGCNMCWTDQKPCIYEDDTALLGEKLEVADVITIVTPIYWYSFPGGLKLVIDKFYPYSPGVIKEPLKPKIVNLIVIGENDENKIFEQMSNSIALATKHLHWQVGEMVYVTVEDKNYEQFKELAAKL